MNTTKSTFSNQADSTARHWASSRVLIVTAVDAEKKNPSRPG